MTEAEIKDWEYFHIYGVCYICGARPTDDTAEVTSLFGLGMCEECDSLYYVDDQYPPIAIPYSEWFEDERPDALGYRRT